MTRLPGARLLRPSAVSSNETDEQRMVRVAAGDVDAYRALYERYKRPIMSYALGLVGNRAVAEEIMQETFLRVYRARENYAPEAKFTTWLWTIARNCSLDHLRKKKELALDPQADLAPLDEHAENTGSPEAERLMIAQATKQAIEDCLQTLGNSQRQAISMRTFSDLNYDEIGEAMMISLSSVKSLIFRAKAGLVDCLKGKGYGK